MNIKGKVHCLFEQSGVFKREFIKLGIPAEDYDIQNSFGETDHTDDLFKAIEDAYDGKPSVFDNMTSDDLVLAFFPCIKFCSVMEQIQHEDFYDASHRNNSNFGTSEYYRRKWEVLRGFSIDRFKFYDIALKMTAVMQIKGLRMIMENPWHPTNFTNHFFFMRVSLIDKNRTSRGDVFRKPTAYWFVNCKPTHAITSQPTSKDKVLTITAGSGVVATKKKLRGKVDKKTLDAKMLDHKSKNGLCDTDRSLITSDYARNFICDFILGGGADRSSAAVGHVRRIGKGRRNQMTIDNETRRYILDRLTAIRDAANGKNPGRKERAVLRAVREIEEVVK